MAIDPLPEDISLKCSYCGYVFTAACSPVHVTEICPICRGSVIIQRAQTSEKGADAAALKPDRVNASQELLAVAAEAPVARQSVIAPLAHTEPEPVVAPKTEPPKQPVEHTAPALAESPAHAAPPAPARIEPAASAPAPQPVQPPVMAAIENVAPLKVDTFEAAPVHTEKVVQEPQQPPQSIVPPPVELLDTYKMPSQFKFPAISENAAADAKGPPSSANSPEPAKAVVTAPTAIIASVRPDTAAYSPRLTISPVKPAKPTRWGLIAATLLIAGAAGTWIVLSVLSGMALTERKNKIDATMALAQRAFVENKIQDAATYAQDAQSALTVPGAPEFEPEFKQKWQENIKLFLSAGTKASQLEAKFLEKEKNPAEVRRDFEDKKSLWERDGKDKPENKQLLALLQIKMAQLETFESEQKLAKLRENLADAEKLYKAEKIEEAAKVADQIVAAMPVKPTVQDAELQKRAGVLTDRATKLADTEKLATAAKGAQISAAKQLVQAEIGKLDPANDDLKPLLLRYAMLLKGLESAESVQVIAASKHTLDDAESLYKKMKIEEAAKMAAQVIADIPPKLAEQNRDLLKRAEILVDHNNKLAVAAKIRAAGKDSIPEAKKLLQAEIDKLDASNVELRPLVARVEAYKRELVQEERAIRHKAMREKKNAEGKDYALSPDDAADLLKKLRKFSEIDEKCVPGELDFDGYTFNFGPKEYRLCLHHESKDKSVLYLESEDNRIAIDPRHFGQGDKSFRPRSHRAFYHAMALAEAMKKAGIKSDDIWDTREEAPFVSARRFDKEGNEYIFLDDRLYMGKAQEKTNRQKKIEDEFRAEAEALATAVENDAPTPENTRKTIAFAVRASAVEADWNDHLEGEFVRKVIDEGYIETNMPGAEGRLKKELAEYRAGYKVVSEPFVNFIGACPEGEATELRTYEDRAVWRIYDKASDTTSFAITNPDDEKDCLFIVFDFPGKLTELPAGKPPAKVRMTHQAVGAISWYDPATNKMGYDKAKWDFASTLEVPAIRDSDRVSLGYGTSSWSLPPHVLLIDKSGRSKALVTPYGRVDVQDFKKIPDAAKRKAAMDEFLDKLATVLPNKPEGCYQHLYFRYFFQYILDSPVTDRPDLLGSRGHTGDIHQTTYQSLERLMGGRYVGDCDDIAEMYMTLERKMGKLSYVMSLPGHAACGWVEKEPKNSLYTFYILQTGPARRFEDVSLDKVVEKAYRAFDPEGTAHFDPKSLAFNFRFNNEPTRTTYWLSSRMFVDGPYGEAMERVQSYWHFHFYALGIETMKAMIDNGDRVSENWNEIAGLYGQVREVDDSIRCSMESIKNLTASEKLSRMSEEYRIATMWRSEHENEKAFERIRKTIVELKQIQRTQETFEYLGMRMQVAGLLLALDRPWEAWDLLRPDIDLLGKPDRYFLKLEHVGVLTSSFLKMKDMIRNHKRITAAENRQMNELEKVLDFFYSRGEAIFEDSDGFDDYMRKYAYIGIYYAGKQGRKKYLDELLKDGPYPDPGTKREHANRKNPKELIAEDWKWIRVALSSYSIAIGDAIDLDDPPEVWRIDEAVKLCDQMAKTGVVASRFGSLASYEFVLLSNRVLRDFLVKDWADLEVVVKETAKRDWAKLTTDVAETFGKGARFCTPEEFATQYKMLTKYIKSKPTFFTVVYEAYRADGIKHSIAASKIALECNPGDLDMKREADYLEKLAEKRLKKMVEKEKTNKDAKDKDKGEKVEKEPVPAK